MSEAGQRAPRRLRLFFALWPSDGERAALAAAAAPIVARVAGQHVPPGNLHVTLAFLGSVTGPGFAPLVQLGGQGRWPAVRLEFRRVEYWARPRVLVALADHVPSAALVMVERLWTGLETLGFRRELRPWQPHLTLVRQVRRRPPEGLAMAAAVGNGSAWRLALVESATHADGPRYRALADWPLGGDSPL